MQQIFTLHLSTNILRQYTITERIQRLNIDLKGLFSSKVIHKSVFALAKRETFSDSLESPLITQITLTGLKIHQTPKNVRGGGEGITSITIGLTSRGERGVCGNNRFRKFIYELNLVAR